jgi:hypothetical protein
VRLHHLHRLHHLRWPPSPAPAAGLDLADALADAGLNLADALADAGLDLADAGLDLAEDKPGCTWPRPWPATARLPPLTRHWPPSAAAQAQARPHGNQSIPWPAI